MEAAAEKQSSKLKTILENEVEDSLDLQVIDQAIESNKNKQVGKFIRWALRAVVTVCTRFGYAHLDLA